MSRTLQIVQLSLATMLIVTASSTATAQAQSGSEIGLDGYCPVCIIEAKKWVRGSSDYEVEFDGTRYQFPDAATRDKFAAMPERYAPALGGDCIVCWAKAGKRVAGSPQHAVIHNQRLFLFPSEKEKQMFMDTAAEFENSDVAAKGQCTVCQVMANKSVAGKPEFTAIHQGMRYFFPSDKERQMFLAEPTKFVSTSAPQAANKPVAKKAMTFVGVTGCAACEHGVHPIGSPQELGLAVNSPNGMIYVIEDAHRLYPQLYKQRFDGKNVKVSGNIIRQDGKFAWVSPQQVELVN